MRFFFSFERECVRAREWGLVGEGRCVKGTDTEGPRESQANSILTSEVMWNSISPEIMTWAKAWVRSLTIWATQGWLWIRWIVPFDLCNHFFCIIYSFTFSKTHIIFTLYLWQLSYKLLVSITCHLYFFFFPVSSELWIARNLPGY